MTALEPYPEYKNCTVGWIDSIPVGWDVVPLMGCVSEVSRSNAGLRERNLLSLSYGRIVRKDISTNGGLLPESFETYQIIEPDDLVFRLTDLQNDKRSLRSALVTERGIITSAYLAVKPRGISPRFLSYAMRDTDSRKVFYSMGGGLRQSMKYSDMKRLPVVRPSLQEQATIVSFLDRETLEIDAFIADQEELIGVLAERRDASWQTALNGFTTPELPVRRVIKSIVDGPFGSSLTSAHYVDEGARVIRLGNIGVNTFRDSDKAFISMDYFAELAAHSVVAGDVVIAGLGDERMPLGRASVVPEIGPAIVKADCYRVRPNDLVTAEYLAFALSAPQTRARMRALSRGSTRERLNTSVVRDVLIPVPSRDRQAALLESAGIAIREIDAAIADARQAIALSRERRAALISAAVTGKIDVRNHGKAA